MYIYVLYSFNFIRFSYICSLPPPPSLSLSLSLQVALPEKLLVYEMVADALQPTPSTSSSATVMTPSGQYRIIQCLTTDMECSLLVVCDQHIVLCQEKKLVCLTLTGEKQR